MTSLVKKIDQATAKHQEEKMGSFVVFCSDDKAMPDKLKKLAAAQKLQHTILTLDRPAGPEDYHVAKEAAITVVLYERRNVKANFAFAKGDLTEKDIAGVVAGLEKILP